MKREEKRIQASVAYNEQHGKLKVIGGSAILSDEEFIAFNKNPDFIAGAEWADETMIDKAIDWLEDNVFSSEQLDRNYSDKFRKAMEE